MDGGSNVRDETSLAFAKPETTAQRHPVELDRDRLIKLLNMTTSRHDPEALVAIRMSNDLLHQHRMSWSDIVGHPDGPASPGLQGQTQSRAQHAQGTATEDAPTPRTNLNVNRAHAARDALKARIKTVPIWLRLLFFPLWAGAEVIASVVLIERNWLIRSLAMIPVLFVTGLCSVLWWLIADRLAAVFR